MRTGYLRLTHKPERRTVTGREKGYRDRAELAARMGDDLRRLTNAELARKYGTTIDRVKRIRDDAVTPMVVRESAPMPMAKATPKLPPLPSVWRGVAPIQEPINVWKETPQQLAARLEQLPVAIMFHSRIAHTPNPVILPRPRWTPPEDEHGGVDHAPSWMRIKW